jgi:hypothetical protein
MATGPTPSPPFRPARPVVERREGGRIYLIVQETPDTSSRIETWSDAFEVTNRLLGRIEDTLENINANMEKSNRRLTAGLRETGAKIAANRRLLDEIVTGRS